MTLAHSQLQRFVSRVAASVVLAACLVAGALVLPAHAASTGHVRGRVTSWRTGAPIDSATIRIAALGLRTTSRADGSFAFHEAVSVPAGVRRVDVVATAPGFGRWTILGVPVWASDTLELTVQLRPFAWTHRVQRPMERSGEEASKSPAAPTGETCTGWVYQIVPPQNIWVYVTPDKKAEQFDFTFYAAHVLPKEWIPSWDADALGAGAIAVKTYAAFRAMPGNARTSGPGCYDILDTTADQVFDPTYTTAATEQAVDSTMGSVLYQNGGLFMSHYFAGAKTDPCAAVTGEHAGWMSQWGTQTCALSGVLWPDIVTTFYANTTWRYLRNFLLNPEASSAPTYPWAGVFATFARTAGGYNSGWSWSVTNTTTDRWGTLRQDRPFAVSTGTTFHEAVALSCPSSSPTSCTFQLKVIVLLQGDAVSTKIQRVTEPRDGAWRQYSFDPPAAGVTGDTVRFSVASQQNFGLDAAYLDSPFGG
jgi:hypothetical protein